MPESTFIADANFTKYVGVLRDFPWSLGDTFDLAYFTPWDRATLFQDLAMEQPVTADGQSVRVMLDTSGNGYHWVAPSDAVRPVYRSGSGQPRLEFANSGLSMAAAGLGVFSGVKYGMFCMAMSLDAINTFRNILRFNTPSNDSLFVLRTQASAASIEHTARRLTGESGVTAALARGTGVNVWTGILDWASGSVELHRGGETAGTSASGMTPGSTSGTAATTAGLGHYEASGYAAMSFYGGILLAGDTNPKPYRSQIEQLLAVRSGAPVT